MDSPTLQQELKTTLKRLPKGYKAIAKLFEDQGITGVPEFAQACPVARWLRREMGVPYASVAPTDISVADEGGDRARVGWPDVSSHVDRFIVEFDSRKFPALIDQETEPPRRSVVDDGVDYEPL